MRSTSSYVSTNLVYIAFPLSTNFLCITDNFKAGRVENAHIVE